MKSIEAVCSVLPALALWAGLVLGTGCAAQSENFDDKDWTVGHGHRSSAWREVESLFGETPSGDVARGYDYDLRAVRHDLVMKKNAKPAVRCPCLDVVVGRPTDRVFAWAGMKPPISPNNLVIAFRTKGSQCPIAIVRPRPSIQAVQLRGHDVVVVIEELPADRPQALGAIIPKPRGEGGLYVRPAGGKDTTIMYARQLSGYCRVPLEAAQIETIK